MEAEGNPRPPTLNDSPVFACGIWKSWALESGIQLKGSGIPQTIGIGNPSSSERNPQSTARSPESMTVLDSLTFGDTAFVAHGIVCSDNKQGCHGQGKVRENENFSRSGKGQGIF